MIISEIIKEKNWLLIDFFSQILDNKKTDTLVDDIIDMFAFYCSFKNVSILFNKTNNICVYKLGNDYFQSYFSYKNNDNPLTLFKNDIFTFEPGKDLSYKEILDKCYQNSKI